MLDARSASQAWHAPGAYDSAQVAHGAAAPRSFALDHTGEQGPRGEDAPIQSAPLLSRPLSQPQWGSDAQPSPVYSAFSDLTDERGRQFLAAGSGAPSATPPWLSSRSRSVSPDFQRRASDASSIAASDNRTQLAVRNLPFSARWQDVKDLFRRAGTVLRADVQLLPDGRSSGNGTVLFASMEDAERATDMLHGYTWQGRVLSVKLDAGEELQPLPQPEHFAQPWPQGGVPGVAWAYPQPPVPPVPPPVHAPLPYPGRVLFIGNLPFHCQWQDLKDLFRAAGNIQRADVALNADGRSRGFGTVLFASPHDAQNAVRLFHGYEYGGRTLKVHFDRLALFQPAPAGVPSDPSEYSAAFSETPVPQTSKDTHELDDLAPEPVLPSSTRAPPRPGRITMPQAMSRAPSQTGAMSFHPGDMVTPTAAALGYPVSAVPGFVLGQIPETPPLYHPHFLSPGVGHYGSPIGAGRMTPGGFTPLVNSTIGAPMDYMSVAGTQQYAQTPLPYYDIGYMHPFTPLGPLPPTPHWSQPARAPQRRVEDDDEPPARDESSASDIKDTTAQLTSMIARMSVKGAARNSTHAPGLSPERNTAKQALTRLRENLAQKAPGENDNTDTADDGNAADSHEPADATATEKGPVE